MALVILTVTRGETRLIDGANSAITQKITLGLGTSRTSAVTSKVVNVLSANRTGTLRVETSAGFTSLGPSLSGLNLCLTRLKLTDQFGNLVTLSVERVPLFLDFGGETNADVSSVNLRKAVTNLSETVPQFFNSDVVLLVREGTTRAW